MRWWLMLGGAAVVAGLLAQRVALPGGWLIGSLLVALVAALSQPGHPKVPMGAFKTAQAVIGILLASTFQPDVLPLIAAHALPVLLVVAGTLSLSLGVSLILTRVTTLDRNTAMLGTLPGGASGMIALSASLGADARFVALMHYTRLVLVVLTASLLARFVLHPTGHTFVPIVASVTAVLGSVLWLDYGMTVILAVAGVGLGTLLRLPAGALLGPLILGLIAMAFCKQHLLWPPGVVPAAYLIVGVYVGLLFDSASVRAAGKLLPVVLLSTLILICSCAAMGWGLARATHTDLLTGYLAATPGGMDTITIVALGSGADIPLMLAVQLARLLTIMFAGPMLARFLRRNSQNVD
jgi:membrane AbrB-like protein